MLPTPPARSLLTVLCCALVALIAPAAASAATLFDQTDLTPSNGRFTSQDFDFQFNDFDTEIADDFVVPAGQSWQLNAVAAEGTNTFDEGPETPPSLARVTIYANSGSGAPAAELFSQDVVATPDNYAFGFTGAPALGFGAYWVSVRAVGGGPTDQWYWRTAAETRGREVMFRNPGDGFNVDCTIFKLLRSCITANPTLGDARFSLSGASANATVVKPKAGKPQLNKKKGTAKLPVTVAGPGELTLSESGGIKAQSAAFEISGKTKLNIVPTGKTARKLKKKGKLELEAELTFTPEAGPASKVSKSVKLKRK